MKQKRRQGLKLVPSQRAATSKRGRPNAAAVQARRDRLQEVALEVFLEFGYEATRLSDIAERAGASKATLYSRFASKEDLFCAVIKERVERASPPFDKLFQEQHLPLDKALRDFVFNWLTYAVQDDLQAFNRLVFAESRRFPALGRLFWEAKHVRHQAKLADFFRFEISKGHLCDGDAMLMACQFLDLAFLEVIVKILLGVQTPMTATERRKRGEDAVTAFMLLYGPRS